MKSKFAVPPQRRVLIENRVAGPSPVITIFTKRGIYWIRADKVVARSAKMVGL